MHAEVFLVQGPSDLGKIRSLKDGDVLRIGYGTFPGGHSISGIANLTVEGTDPKNRPVFEGGKEAFHFSRTPGLKLRNIIVRGQTGNGINIDDGGLLDQPVENILIENVKVEDIGPNGNFDGIKCSGLKKLEIRNCEITGWGGQAIDFVGCRDALITGCTITGKPGFSQNTGLQFKGGSENITIEKCKLLNAGERPIKPAVPRGRISSVRRARSTKPAVFSFGTMRSKAVFVRRPSPGSPKWNSPGTRSSAPRNGFSVSFRKLRNRASNHAAT